MASRDHAPGASGVCAGAAVERLSAAAAVMRTLNLSMALPLIAELVSPRPAQEHPFLAMTAAHPLQAGEKDL
jgi:hypothetical protein